MVKNVKYSFLLSYHFSLPHLGRKRGLIT